MPMNSAQQKVELYEVPAAGGASASGDFDSKGTNVTKKSEKSSSAFRTISEVAQELDVQQHVLRFWETKFTQIKPLKRGGGRRYYRPEDIEILRRVHHLLYAEGYTIKGVQKLMKGQGRNQVIAQINVEAEGGAPASEAAPVRAAIADERRPAIDLPLSDRQKAILGSMLGELKELRDMLRS